MLDIFLPEAGYEGYLSLLVDAWRRWDIRVFSYCPGNYSSIGTACSMIEGQINQDRRLRRRIEQIREMVTRTSLQKRVDPPGHETLGNVFWRKRHDRASIRYMTAPSAQSIPRDAPRLAATNPITDLNQPGTCLRLTTHSLSGRYLPVMVKELATIS